MVGISIRHKWVKTECWLYFSGTYCQQREVEAITEGVEDNEGMVRPDFLLVDLREIFFRFKVGGRGKKRKKRSENDQFTGHFQSFFFIFRAFFLFIFRAFFFLISPEQTVKLVK